MLKKIFEIILSILILITITITIYSLVQIKILKKDYINLFNYTAFEVITGSMSPSIEIGDIVIVKIDKNYRVEVEDIVVFKDKDSFITHRIKEIKRTGIITKGDANNATDMPINKEDIIGEVIKIIPKFGVMKKVLKSPQVIISIFTTMFLIGITFTYDKKNKKTKGKHYA